MQRYGIRRIAVWDKLNQKTYVVVLSVRQPSSLTIKPKDDVKDFRDRALPSMVNFKIEGTSFDIGRPMLNYLNTLIAGNGACAEVVTRRTANTPVYDGIYLFTGDNYLGLDYEYTITEKERMVKLILEGDMDNDTAQTLLTDAVSNNTIQTLSGFNEVDFRTQDHRPSNFGGLEYYNGSYYALFPKEDIVSRKLTLKTKGAKNAYSKTLVSMIEASLEVEILKSSKVDVMSFFTMDRFRKIKWTENDLSGKAEKHIFDAGVLSMVPEAGIGDDKRTVKLAFKGTIPTDSTSYASDGSGDTYTWSL